MSRYYGGWAPYVPVAERRREAARAAARLRKQGRVLAPVTVPGRAIAATVWGKAWCDNMESYRDYESRLPRGRAYVRNGSVLDLQIAPGEVEALVNGSELYRIGVSIKQLPAAAWRRICADCAGRIDSVVELLQGRFSKGVMERLCRQEGGLFPRPSDIRFTCSCPDHASMCKHVAAALYGVGARLDHAPELLFRLRAVDETGLVAGVGADLPTAKAPPAAGKVLHADDMAALFGLEMAAAAPPAGQRPGTSGARRARDTTTTSQPMPHAPKAGRSGKAGDARGAEQRTPGASRKAAAEVGSAAGPSTAKIRAARPAKAGRPRAVADGGGAPATAPDKPPRSGRRSTEPRPAPQAGSRRS